MLNSMLNSSEKSGPLLAATERIFTLKKKKKSDLFFLILNIFGKPIF